jgi:hypothetical protein
MIEDGCVPSSYQIEVTERCDQLEVVISFLKLMSHCLQMSCFDDQNG